MLRNVNFIIIRPRGIIFPFYLHTEKCTILISACKSDAYIYIRLDVYHARLNAGNENTPGFKVSNK